MSYIHLFEILPAPHFFNFVTFTMQSFITILLSVIAIHQPYNLKFIIYQH